MSKTYLVCIEQDRVTETAKAYGLEKADRTFGQTARPGYVWIPKSVSSVWAPTREEYAAEYGDHDAAVYWTPDRYYFVEVPAWVARDRDWFEALYY